VLAPSHSYPLVNDCKAAGADLRQASTNGRCRTHSGHSSERVQLSDGAALLARVPRLATSAQIKVARSADGRSAGLPPCAAAAPS